MHRVYGERKERLFSDLPHTLIEIGPGAGANLRYYRARSQVVAIEPNPMMHTRLRRRAEELDIGLDVRGGRAERLDADDASAEAVISTLVLCSVEDLARALGEIHRVLAPGGRFIFVEHVAAPVGSGLRTYQNAIHAPWRWIAEGCHTNRDTIAAIEAAGFSDIEVESFRAFTPLIPVTPHIAGVARK